LAYPARASFHILDKVDAERIHEAALSVLSDVGVLVKSEPALRMLRGIGADAESLSVEALREVGPGGLFLGRRDTLSKFRTELWMPPLGQRMNYEHWKAGGRPDISTNAREKALALSSEPPSSPLDGDLEERLEELLRRATETA
jgi:trimethylamine--corrinoid protein Co-methyltransferase